MSFSERAPANRRALPGNTDNLWGLELKLSQEQSTAAAMDQWITGIPGRIPGHVIFVENPEHTNYAKTLASEGSTILVLNGDEDVEGTVRVSGSFDAAGEELLVDGSLSLEIQDYVAIPFVNLVGVTIVRITTEEDWQAFFDDAREAWTSGHFIQQLTEANAVLAERALLTGQNKEDCLLTRLHIAWDGTVLNGPYGTMIGKVGDGLADLRVRSVSLRPESAVASASPSTQIRDLLAASPWIPRYLAALDAWKFIPREERADTRLVGFGVSLYGSALNEGPPSAVAPFILVKGSQHTLLDASTGRVFNIGADAAVIVEALSNMGDLTKAASVVASVINVSPAVAGEAVQAVFAHFEQLGIDVIGERR
ncbi:daptide biosynthesis RiPP recognition protein [Paenarthrobacter sp. NPDC090517]|uniref:daptide biosynthesis RiPP recognition protein n=1 Tax=Paenarthrobacter sp. NPDC090517 TaxID=3364381 RepID=UPI0038290E59